MKQLINFFCHTTDFCALRKKKYYFFLYVNDFIFQDLKYRKAKLRKKILAGSLHNHQPEL